jgi:hypothetical protein
MTEEAGEALRSAKTMLDPASQALIASGASASPRTPLENWKESLLPH